MLVEHARNLMGITDALHAEYGDTDGTAIITALECSLNGRSITIEIQPDTVLAKAYGGAATAVEQTTCNYGLNVSVQDLASQGGLLVTATDDTGEVRAVERPDHPFFVGTLYQPQLTSSPEVPAPVLAAFVAAVLA